MKDMRTVLMDQHPRIIIVIVRIASDVRALVDNQDLFARIHSEALSHDAAREARSNN